MELEQLLKEFDLNDKQIKIYITLLQMGEGTIQEIARKTAIKRTTVYSVLDTLVQRNLVAINKKGSHRNYIAEDPKRLPNIFNEERRKLENQHNKLIEALPVLASLYNAGATRPKISVYEGIEGIKTIFEDTLLLPQGTETYAYASYTDIRSHLGDYILDYIKRRVEKGITQRAIVEDSPLVREEILKNDQKELRKTRLVNKDQFPLPLDQINIYGNKIFIASFTDMVAILIESAPIAKAMKSIFELSWLGAKEVGK